MGTGRALLRSSCFFWGSAAAGAEGLMPISSQIAAAFEPCSIVSESLGTDKLWALLKARRGLVDYEQMPMEHHAVLLSSLFFSAHSHESPQIRVCIGQLLNSYMR